MIDGLDKFDCIDCDAPVTRFRSWPGQPHRCAGCEFLTWIEDTATREAMRRHMLRDGTIGRQEP